MSHNDFVRRNGVWQPSAVPTSQGDVAPLDTNAAALLNGDAGGTWAPATPIVIGQGQLRGDSCFDATYSGFTGGVSTKGGGALYLNTLPAWPAVQAPGGSFAIPSRTVNVDIFRCSGNFSGIRNALQVSTNPLGVFPGANCGPLVFSIPKRFLHQGAQLGYVALQMVIKNLVQGVPVTPPSMGFTIMNADGSTVARSTSMFRTWKASTSYTRTPTQYIIPSSTKSDGRIYWCAEAGTTGSTEPAWNTVGPVTDGSVTWTPVDSSGQMPYSPAQFPFGVPVTSNGIAYDATTAYSVAGTSKITVGMTFSTWTNAAQTPLVIDSTKYEYIVNVNHDSLPLPGVTFTSLQLLFQDITTLQTE